MGNTLTDIIYNISVSQIWDQLFEPLCSLNFGIGGDSTQHVLWRIQNGELEHITPKVRALLQFYYIVFLFRAEIVVNFKVFTLDV